MSYVALYRKYRPNTFENIVGQENITKILKNQIKLGKVSHAYIFSGSRGTGKTSAAKVFARAVNCLNPRDGEPCNECEVCKNILESNTTDIVEMDAASNNSVENIRQIRQEVAFATIDLKYRVYIIDEAHMLTTSAFNALLKTLEEPPQNVIFILATTEQHKIPITILSRCLRFEFSKIPEDIIMKRLEFVLKDEKVEYEPEAIKYIAKLADGALRDALSILDRCLSENEDKLLLKNVEQIVGAIDKDIFENIVSAIMHYDSIKAVENIDVVVKKGKDLRELAYRLSEYFLDLLINEKEDSLKEKYVYVIDKLSKLDSDIRNSSKPVIVFKVSIVELCNINNYIKNDDNSSNVKSISTVDNKVVENLLSKIETLESKINTFEKKIADNNIANTSTNNKEENIEKKDPKKLNETNNDKNIDLANCIPFDKEVDLKNAICLKGKINIYSALVSSKMYSNDDDIIIVTDNGFSYSKINNDETIEEIATVLHEKYGINKKIKTFLNEKSGKKASKIEECLKNCDVKYTEVD